MIGWIILVFTAVIYMILAAIFHYQSLTAFVRDLSTPGKIIFVAVVTLFMTHLLISNETGAKHDPLDKLEHEIHDLSH